MADKTQSEKEASLRAFIDRVNSYRSSSRRWDIPKDQLEYLRRMDEDACAFFVDNMTAEILMTIVEVLGRHVPAGHADNHILFAIRCGYESRKKRERVEMCAPKMLEFGK